MPYYPVWQRGAKDIVGGIIINIIIILLMNMKKFTPSCTLKYGGEY